MRFWATVGIRISHVHITYALRPDAAFMAVLTTRLMNTTGHMTYCAVYMELFPVLVRQDTAVGAMERGPAELRGYMLSDSDWSRLVAR